MLSHVLWGVLGSYALISYVEWHLHRNEMHHKGWLSRYEKSLFHNHQKVHHPTYHDDFETSSPPEHPEIGLTISTSRTLKYIALPLLAVAYFLPVEACILLLMTVLHHRLWNMFHVEMHYPAQRWFAATSLFRFLRRYHMVHHKHWTKNMNIIAIGADHLLGTYQKPATC